MAFPVLFAQWQMCFIYASKKEKEREKKIQPAGRPTGIVKARLYWDGVIFL